MNLRCFEKHVCVFNNMQQNKAQYTAHKEIFIQRHAPGSICIIVAVMIQGMYMHHRPLAFCRVKLKYVLSGLDLKLIKEAIGKGECEQFEIHIALQPKSRWIVIREFN